MDDRERKPDSETPEETGAGQEARPAQSPQRTHESGYGGRGREPRTSSDQREPKEPTGQTPA